MMRRACIAIVLLSQAVMAQTTSPLMARCLTCSRLAQQSDSAIWSRDAVGALEHARAGLQQDSNDVALLIRAARSELTLGIVIDHRVGDQHYMEATKYARRAVALAPNSADAHFFLAAVLGRRSLRSGFRSAISLASETYKEASRALALDSNHAGAHEVVGKLHSEVRKLPWITRRLIATLSRLDVARTASWESAEHHLRRSIALDSTLMMSRVDLSQLYLRTGRRPEATAMVEQLEHMPRHSPADSTFQVEARKRLGWYP